MNSSNNYSNSFTFKILEKINKIQEKGQNVKMKTKPKFEATLSDTKTMFTNNREYFDKMFEEPSQRKLLIEFTYTIDDLESKLNKLSLIRFCRDRYLNKLIK